MKNTFRFIFALAITAAFASCASVQKTPELNRVYVTNTTPVDLLPPSAIRTEIDEMQYFEGTFAEKSFSTMLYLQADSTQIQVLMLNEMGIEIGTLTYDGITCQMESAFFPKKLKAEYIILDLQNAYADSEELQTHYKKYGLTFEQSGTTRTLSRKNTLIEEITAEDNILTIKNHLRGYMYKLTAGE